MIHMLIGIQGSGKTTFAKKLAKKYNCEIISTDAVRKSIPGIKEELVWPVVYRRCAEAIREARDAIFDATNITPKVRRRFVSEVEKHNVKVKMKAYFLNTDKEVCYQRVIKRNANTKELFLPPEVVFSYSDKMIPPTLAEGFEEILIIENGNIVKNID